MVCTRCGNEIQGKPVMVIYGDPAFDRKPQIPFAVDKSCYDENRRVKVAEWVTGDTGEPELREFTITRYKKA